MFIPVKYRNGKEGMVESSELEELIHSNKIKKFLRLEGWVTAGNDPTRKIIKDYKGVTGEAAQKITIFRERDWRGYVNV